MNQPKYRRVLIKISGEQLAGNRGYGIDPGFIDQVAKQLVGVEKETRAQIIIVTGGGNIMRGAAIANKGIDRATGDYMGMLATIINGAALTDLLEANGQPTRLLSRLEVDSIAEPYIRRRALRHLEKGRIVIVAGGMGNPFMTTDTAAVSAALELNCDLVIKPTKVDGVYDKDPVIHSDAKHLPTVDYLEAITNDQIRVMDNSAVSLAMDNSLPIIVLDLLGKNKIQRAILGESVGTLIG